jgi:TonB family protein
MAMRVKLCVALLGFGVIACGTFAQSQPNRAGGGSSSPATADSATDKSAAQTDSSGSEKPIQVNANVTSARMLHFVLPKYPRDAKKAHITGDVVLHCIIAKDGSVKNLQIISGPPMLLKSATEAVAKWKYRPTVLAGAPTEIETTITVRFKLP